MGKTYLRGPRKYEILTGPGVSTSYCEYSPEAETDSIDVKELQDAIEESFEDMGEKGLAEYTSRRDYMDKVISIHPPIPCDRNGRVLSGEVYDPYLFWTVYTSDVLDKKEEKSLLDYITGQCSDGWGEGFEQHPVTKYSGEWEEEYEDEDPDTGEMDWGTETYSATYEVFYSPWQYRNWNIKITSSGEVREKKTSRKNNYITIKEDSVRIELEDQDVILEKGDRIKIKESRDDRGMLGADELDVLSSIEGNLFYYASQSSEKIIKEGISTIKGLLDKVNSRMKSDNLFISIALKEYVREIIKNLEEY